MCGKTDSMPGFMAKLHMKKLVFFHSFKKLAKIVFQEVNRCVGVHNHVVLPKDILKKRNFSLHFKFFKYLLKSAKVELSSNSRVQV